MDTLTSADIAAAAERVQGWLKPTSLFESHRLSQQSGRRVFIKPESLGVTGSFKIRGALNRMLGLDPEQRAGGVVAYSSGNHAQAVAQSARWLDIHATIVMPADAPRLKIDNTRQLGAEVILYDRYTESREDIAADIAARTGAILIPPFDDPAIIAGQGTVGHEIVATLRDLDLVPELVATPCGGGGLTAGVSTAVRASFPNTTCIGVEPDHYDDHRRSLEAGRRVTLESAPGTICDALMAPVPGELTFAINRRNLAGVVTVSDSAVLRAMRFAAEQLRLVVEPGGAVALAALLAESLPDGSGPVVIVLSGGNADRSILARALASDDD